MHFREFVLNVAREYEFGRPLLVEGYLGRHRSLRARSEHGHLERPPGLRERGLGGGRLIAAVRHAVRTLFVLARAVGIPVRRIHQFAERGRVPFAQPVARLLPAEDVTRGLALMRAW